MRWILLVLVLITGCGPAGERIAGGDLDEGAFGNPTRANMLVMSGEAGFVSDLNTRFARSVPSVNTTIVPNFSGCVARCRAWSSTCSPATTPPCRFVDGSRGR